MSAVALLVNAADIYTFTFVLILMLSAKYTMMMDGARAECSTVEVASFSTLLWRYNANRVPE